MHKPNVYNHRDIRDRIENNFDVEVPANATNLYASDDGAFMDVHCYAAFTFSSADEWEIFVGEQLGLPLEKFRRSSDIAAFTEYGPSTWVGEHKSETWDILEFSNYLIYSEYDTRQEVVYVPEANRIFLFTAY